MTDTIDATDLAKFGQCKTTSVNLRFTKVSPQPLRPNLQRGPRCEQQVSASSLRQLPWNSKRNGIVSVSDVKIPLLAPTARGIHCAAGDFYIDPAQAVPFAVITHAHSDHARSGSENYLTAAPGKPVLQERLGPKAHIEALPYGKSVTQNGVTISLHPAGHILGSAQVRVEHRGEVWVVSGDYKTEAEPSCDPFEPVPCHTFVTECTFGLPVYRWQPQSEILRDIHSWWRQSQAAQRTSVLFVYSLGKAQRVLAAIDSSIGPICVHETVARFLPLYAAAGVKLPEVVSADPDKNLLENGRALVLAPSSTAGTPWLRQFGEASTAFASGWMQLRGARRREALDRGFPLSDHADWDGLLTAIRETGASRILATHGTAGPLVRWLREAGQDADAWSLRLPETEDELSQAKTRAPRNTDPQLTLDIPDPDA